MEEDVLAEELGALIRRLRLESGYSQAGFAEVCKIDRAHMGEVERGEVNVTVRIALKIAPGAVAVQDGCPDCRCDPTHTWVVDNLYSLVDPDRESSVNWPRSY